MGNTSLARAVHSASGWCVTASGSAAVSMKHGAELRRRRARKGGTTYGNRGAQRPANRPAAPSRIAPAPTKAAVTSRSSSTRAMRGAEGVVDVDEALCVADLVRRAARRLRDRLERRPVGWHRDDAPLAVPLGLDHAPVGAERDRVHGDARLDCFPRPFVRRQQATRLEAVREKDDCREGLHGSETVAGRGAGLRPDCFGVRQ